MYCALLGTALFLSPGCQGKPCGVGGSDRRLLRWRRWCQARRSHHACGWNARQGRRGSALCALFLIFLLLLALHPSSPYGTLPILPISHRHFFLVEAFSFLALHPPAPCVTLPILPISHRHFFWSRRGRGATGGRAARVARATRVRARQVGSFLPYVRAHSSHISPLNSFVWCNLARAETRLARLVSRDELHKATARK